MVAYARRINNFNDSVFNENIFLQTFRDLREAGLWSPYKLGSAKLFVFIYIFTFHSARRKRSSDKLVFSSDMVRILPGYPKQLSNDPLVALLAFYLQFPQGVSSDIVGKNVVIAMLKSNVSSIGETMNGTILNVRPLVSAIDSTEENDEESKPSTATIVGACVGVVLLLVIIVALVLAYKRRSR